MHLADGTIRRAVDEPFALDPARRRHLEACPRCRGRAMELREDAELAQRFLAIAAHGPADSEAALRRLDERLSTGGGVPRTGGFRWLRAGDGRHRPVRDPRRRARWVRRSAAALGGLAACAGLLGAGVASGFITIFQPSQVAPVAVTTSDLSSLQELASYGDVSGIPSLTLIPATREQAETLTGVKAPEPASLPQGVTATVSYWVMKGGTVTFTFDGAKAAAVARQLGATLPPMPAGIDGSTLRVTVPSVLIESFGANLADLLQGRTSATAPALVIAVTRAPEVSSDRASASQIEDYLLAQPEVPAGLASEIRAIADPSRTLPVPIPVGLATAQAVAIDGAPGLLIGDQTGLGSLVLWERDGTIRAVLGTLSSDQVLAVADQAG
ncbi:MAG TPA: hypothetical protein VEK76_07000 [Candidatus Binatia bacterium]|nr:hypothetical protein [Candidatus Binatia bacterium]